MLKLRDEQAVGFMNDRHPLIVMRRNSKLHVVPPPLYELTYSLSIPKAVGHIVSDDTFGIRILSEVS